MEDQLHPELAREVMTQQPQKNYDIHPSLQTEVEVEMQPDQNLVQKESEDSIQEASHEPIIEKAQQVNEPKDRQWRAIRQQVEEAKQMKLEAEALARERDFYREQALKQQKTMEAEEDYRSDSEKQLHREMQELKEQIARQAKDTEAAKRQASVASAEARLIQDYPDIKEVVTNENIQQLEQNYPHLYNSVISSSDVYSVGAAAYELIIAKGIAQRSSKNTASYAQQSNPNRNKPRSASTVAPQAGETPIQRAGNFMGNAISSEDERKALYHEMINSARNKVF